MPMPHTIDDLLILMRRLRDPVAGCPWDRQQTFESLVKFTLEEAYEVADAIERGARDELPGELGDLLFQVVFYAQLGAEVGDFDFATVVGAIHEKLVQRHPHVFGAPSATVDVDTVVANWESLKAAERAARGSGESELDGVPVTLPALSRALKLQRRAARVNFDWPGPEPVFDKVEEELGELREALTQDASEARRLEELGDALFAMVNLARHLALDPDEALRRANQKFERRFRAMEALARADGQALATSPPAVQEQWWARVKRDENPGGNTAQA